MHVLQSRKFAGFRRTMAEGCENVNESTTFFVDLLGARFEIEQH